MNTDLKYKIRTAGLKQWQVAEAIGISERTLIVWLRHELTDEKKDRIVNAIKSLTKGE